MAENLHHETFGFEDNDRRVIVLLNGMTQSTAHWRSQGRALSEHFRVVAYDARGQGDTPAPTSPLTLAEHANDLAGLLDRLGVESANLIGFSHGARIALQFAVDFPERLERLVLVSAAARSTALSRTIVRGWREVLEVGGLEALSWMALPIILGDTYLSENEHVLESIVRASVQRNDAEGVRMLLAAMSDHPDLEHLAEDVDHPTCVVWATEDVLVDREGATELADLCSGELREVEGVGHTIPIEAPSAFREIVVDFLS